MTAAVPVITRSIAAKVLAVVDHGLVNGLGEPEPGKMCVEAAVCYALGLPHGDHPVCVAPALRGLKIRLNDALWSSPQARAKGLRRLALAQLGSAGAIDERDFLRRVAAMTIATVTPRALRAAAAVHPDAKHRDAMRAAAERCEKEGDAAAAAAAADAARYAAVAAAVAVAARYAAAAVAAADADADAARDRALAEFSESVVQVLIEMDAPGCQWLDLAEAA